MIMTRQIGNISESSLRVNSIPDQKKFQAKNEISLIHSSSTRSHTMIEKNRIKYFTSCLNTLPVSLEMTNENENENGNGKGKGNGNGNGRKHGKKMKLMKRSIVQLSSQKIPWEIFTNRKNILLFFWCLVVLTVVTRRFLHISQLQILTVRLSHIR